MASIFGRSWNQPPASRTPNAGQENSLVNVTCQPYEILNHEWVCLRHGMLQDDDWRGEGRAKGEGAKDYQSPCNCDSDMTN